MIPCIIVFGSLGGLTGPAIQSIVAGSVKSNEQGNVQGALTSLMSLTNVIAPLVFVAGVFSFFTKKNAKLDFFGQQLNVPYLPGAPFFIGSVLLVIALLICRSAFRRIPELQTESPSNSETEKAESA